MQARERKATMTLDELIAKQELQELVNEFSILADDRNPQAQGPLFTEDAVLEFQMGPEGEVHEIPAARSSSRPSRGPWVRAARPRPSTTPTASSG